MRKFCACMYLRGSFCSWLAIVRVLLECTLEYTGERRVYIVSNFARDIYHADNTAVQPIFDPGSNFKIHVLEYLGCAQFRAHIQPYVCTHVYSTGSTRTAVPYYYFRVPDEAIYSKTPMFLIQRFY